MPRIIKDGQVIDDTWVLIDKDFVGELPMAKVILPMQYYLDKRDSLNLMCAGLWIDSEEEVEAIGLEANMFPLIAVNFPSFMDGRGFSIGRLLKERYDFTGQLRAIGNAIPDQLFYLKRCGFTSFDLKDGTDLEAACQSLNDFDVSYQSAYDQPEALFRRN
jgi:uncharacterized protein (DUF934 family)